MYLSFSWKGAGAFFTELRKLHFNPPPPSLPLLILSPTSFPRINTYLLPSSPIKPLPHLPSSLLTPSRLFSLYMYFIPYFLPTLYPSPSPLFLSFFLYTFLAQPILSSHFCPPSLPYLPLSVPLLSFFSSPPSVAFFLLPLAILSPHPYSQFLLHPLVFLSLPTTILKSFNPSSPTVVPTLLLLPRAPLPFPPPFPFVLPFPYSSHTDAGLVNGV